MKYFIWSIDWFAMRVNILVIILVIMLVIIVFDCEDYEWSPCCRIYQPHARQHSHESLLNSTPEWWGHLIMFTIIQGPIKRTPIT